MNILEETRKVDIVQVVQGLGLKIHEHRKILCPFHEEKTPSLYLYPNTNTYYCFGCGKHGDVIHFYAGFCQLEYKKAMHELAFHYVPGYIRRAAPPLRELAPRPEIPADNLPDTKEYEYHEVHTEIYETFKEYCESQGETEISQQGNAYLKERGFTVYTLRNFGIFVVKDYHNVNHYMRTRFAAADLRECGLYNEKDNLVFYKHPIVIPYHQKERIVFLQGRIIGTPMDRTPRYQFLSGIPIPLFNSDLLPKIKTGKVVYLTEGAFDCITLVQQGMPAVSLGSVTMFKKEWAKLFRRFEVCFWFDNDDAGQAAKQSYHEIFHRAGLSTHDREVKEGFKDVNEYFTKRDRGSL
ncbi:CHC2 zinc finger domain-containing protein [Persicitalea sp.]|uniref:CHC2 zinc finger domain-containing protein n=1 Tax=Persicitalea sp. TaxID=3100273 RepID=UPI0035930AED